MILQKVIAKFYSVVLQSGVALVLSISTATTAQDLPKKVLVIEGVKLVVEMAESPEAHSRGLMERQSLSEDEGMLFVFEKEQILSFWMKNTYIPLSIGFFDRNKNLIEVLDMDPPRSLLEKEMKKYESKAPARYALEVKQGWFKRKGLVPGKVKPFELRAKGLD